MNPGEERQADRRLAGTPSLTAYWPDVLRYPLRGYAPWILLLAAPMVWQCVSLMQVFMAPVLDGRAVSFVRLLPALLITGVLLLYYLLRIVEHSAEGHGLPPKLDGASLTSGWTVLLQVLLYPTLLLMLCAKPEHAAVAEFITALGLWFWPAHFLILATERELPRALNPLRWLQVMLTLGREYFLLWLALWGSVLLMRELGSRYYGAGVCAVGLYLIFALCHLIGYMAYHRHKALGFRVSVRDPLTEDMEQEQARRLDLVLKRSRDCLQAGDAKAAVAALLAVPPGPANVLAFHEDLLGKLHLRGDTVLIHTQARRMITFHLNAKRSERALEIYESCVNRDRYFDVESPAQLLPLANAALAQKFEELFERIARHAVAERKKIARELMVNFFPMTFLYQGLILSFIGYHAVTLGSQALGDPMVWSASVMSAMPVIDFLAVVWLLPNTLRTFCLHFISSNIQ